eukprot:249376-Rhodomonas_salina.2
MSGADVAVAVTRSGFPEDFAQLQEEVGGAAAADARLAMSGTHRVCCFQVELRMTAEKALGGGAEEEEEEDVVEEEEEEVEEVTKGKKGRKKAVSVLRTPARKEREREREQELEAVTPAAKVDITSLSTSR